ncbi:MAG: NAD(P)-dependent oxidoreductase [Chitinophagaceae bacterium]|jgi:nucleoside-diphosphate-sugar epimerase
MSRILITGASGFLGSNILRNVAEQNDVSIIVRNISNLYRIEDLLHKVTVFNIDELEIEEIVAQSKPDIVIHCATDYGRKDVPQMQIIEANLILPLKLLHFSKLNGVTTFINTDTFLDKRINHYSLSKKQFRDWFQTYSADMLCINMILEHFYGPLDDKTKFVSHIISELLQNKPGIDLTLGEQKRNFIYIDDVVSAFQTVMTYPFENKTGFHDFFIASDTTISIRNFVETLKRFCQNEITNLNFGVIPYRANEIMDSSINIDAMKKLGWSPKISLEDGLKRTIEIEKSHLS